MKQLLTFILCICATNISYAQLKVYSNGTVSIGLATSYSEDTISAVTLNSASDFSSNAAKISVQGVSVNTSGSVVSGRAVGVKGVAGNVAGGYNYGVIGRLVGPYNGAGVFGTMRPSDAVFVDGQYAGYFSGNTKVSGNLTVTGSLSNATLLTAGVNSASPMQLSVIDNADNNTSERLASLNALSFYKGETAISTMNLTEQTDIAAPIETQIMSKKHYAIPVEQIEDVYPELVYTLDDGSKAINYIEMIPLLVQSIGELKAEIAELKGSNAKTRSYNGSTGIGGLEGSDAASLSQNNPNPFVNATNIEMQIPADAACALFCIYDMNGKQIKQITVNERGKTTLNVTSEGLAAGMYLYSLIIDGKVIDTRRMILTK